MEENLKLLVLAKEGDDKAKEKLVEQNLGLVWNIARRYTGRGYDIEDLFQIGCIGLINCIDRFDVNFGVKFSTYAVPLIQGEIRRFLRDDGIIKVSRNLKTILVKVINYRDDVMKRSGLEPGIEEIAVAIKEAPEDIIMALEIPTNQNIVTEYTEKGVNRENELIDKVTLRQAMNELDEKERRLIELRYFQDKTQGEVGRILGMSQVQVSRFEKKILEKMRIYF